MGNVARTTNNDQVSGISFVHARHVLSIGQGAEDGNSDGFPCGGRDNENEKDGLTFRYKIQDIRTLVGHKTDLSQVKVRPAVRLEKGDD